MFGGSLRALHRVTLVLQRLRNQPFNPVVEVLPEPFEGPLGTKPSYRPNMTALGVLCVAEVSLD